MSDKVDNRNTCPFCGGRGRLSKEHPFGKWARPYVLMPHKGTNHHVTRPIDPLGRVHTRRLKRYRDGDPLRQQVRSACKNCNTGWMKSLQDATKPIALKFITGGWPYLSAEEGRILACWSSMVTMNIEYYDPETVRVPQEHRTHLRETVLAGQIMPPPEWYVGIAPYTGSRWHGTFHHSALQIHSPAGTVDLARTDLSGQRTFFALGQVLFHTMCAATPASMDLMSDGNPVTYGANLEIQTLWPVASANFAVTPVLPVDDDEAQVLIKYLGTHDVIEKPE